MPLIRALVATLALSMAAGADGAGMAKIAIGSYHACGLTTLGGVVCWGRNDQGQLGDATKTDRATPVGVYGLAEGVIDIAATGNYSCALRAAGSIQCWGQFVFSEPITIPRDLAGMTSGMTSVSVGGDVCGITESRAVRCFGGASGGQMAYPGLESDMAAVAVGIEHRCALTLAGEVRCFGGNTSGQLGDGTFVFRSTPVAVPGLGPGVRSISAGNFHTCAVLADRTVRCWGLNRDYQLGIGTTDNRATPVEPGGLGGGIAEVIAGSMHTCAVNTARELRCWGGQGVLGHGDFAGRGNAAGLGAVAVDVAGAAANSYNTCSVSTGGRALCWGYNAYGQVGDGQPAFPPNSVYRLTPYEVAGYRGHAVANYQGLWWKSPAGSEAGWGLNLTHQGELIFGTWFTYAADGKGMWLVMPEGRKVGEAVFEGALYRTSGPPFGAASWNSAVVTATPVGNATLVFSNANNGRFLYTVNGVAQEKDITRQVYAQPPVCAFTPAVSASNYQDLWWASPGGTESGWGVNLAHQGDILFATWFTYDTAGAQMWLVMPSGTRTGAGAYSGALYRTTGPAFSSFTPGAAVAATPVGNATFTFADARTGTFAYNVEGVSRSKAIARQSFAAPASSCRPG